jgi:hypothetical protein
MTAENLLRTIDGAYLHFNRVERYKDGPGSDPHDGAQLPADQPGNAATRFEKAPDFSAANYYDVCRERTYACCFGLENADYLWHAYGNSGARGKVGVVFDFARLRTRLNGVFSSGNAKILLGNIVYHQIFNLNYGVVKYVDRDRHHANIAHLANPLEYTYLKDHRFGAEKELRVALSALGMGKFALADGTLMVFPPSLHLQFDFSAAIADGTVREILCASEIDAAFLRAELEKRYIKGAAGKPASAMAAS